jgi:DNA-binding transcriptional MerR regulator
LLTYDKAISEHGERLHIRKATLRYWREEFARHLRALGVPANATQRYMRGETSPRKSDPIHRAIMRGDSTHMRERTEAVARDLSKAGRQVELGKAKLVETRDNIRRAWWNVSEILVRDQQAHLAVQVRRFAEHMPPPMTEREYLAGKLLEPRQREAQPTR